MYLAIVEEGEGMIWLTIVVWIATVMLCLCIDSNAKRIVDAINKLKDK